MNARTIDECLDTLEHLHKFIRVSNLIDEDKKTVLDTIEVLVVSLRTMQPE